MRQYRSNKPADYKSGLEGLRPVVGLRRRHPGDPPAQAGAWRRSAPLGPQGVLLPPAIAALQARFPTAGRPVAGCRSRRGRGAGHGIPLPGEGSMGGGIGLRQREVRMQDGPRVRRKVLVTVTRGGVGALPPGEEVAYAALGGLVASPPQGEPALPETRPTPQREPVAVGPAAHEETP